VAYPRAVGVTLTFEEMLSEVLGLIGKNVVVTVGRWSSPSPRSEEVVWTSEGLERASVYAEGESPWDKGPDGKPRIEVPIQLDPSKGKPGAIDCLLQSVWYRPH